MNDEKRGHPALPADQRKSVMVFARVTAAEKRAVVASAAERGMTVSAYIRSLLEFGKGKS